MGKKWLFKEKEQQILTTVLSFYLCVFVWACMHSKCVLTWIN